MDTYGLRTWVSPFRYLRIMAYLQLPEAFRSLSRLSSALSAKASTLRSLCLTTNLLLSFQVRLHSVAISCWSEFLHSVLMCKNFVFTLSRHSSNDCVNTSLSSLHAQTDIFLYLVVCLFSDISVGLGCLVSNFIFDSFHLISVFDFQGTSRTLSYPSGLKWTRTIDLTLIRRAL